MPYRRAGAQHVTGLFPRDHSSVTRSTFIKIIRRQLHIGGEADGLEQAGPTPTRRRPCWLGYVRRLGGGGHVRHDLLGHTALPDGPLGALLSPFASGASLRWQPC